MGAKPTKLTGEFKEIMDEAKKESKEELKELREELEEEQKAFKMEQKDASDDTEVYYTPEEIENLLVQLGACKKCGDLKICSYCMPEMMEASREFKQIE